MNARATLAIATAVLVAALTLGGCGADDGAPEPAVSAEQSTSGAITSDDATSEAAVEGRIPDGRYARVATEADFDAAGLSEDLREEFLGRDGEMPTAFEFAGDRWTLYVTNDAGVEEVGDLGTLEYDDEGRLVTTSQSTGCPGCVGVTAWSLEGDLLNLELEGDAIDPVDAFVINGEYSREG